MRAHAAHACPTTTLASPRPFDEAEIVVLKLLLRHSDFHRPCPAPELELDIAPAHRRLSCESNIVVREILPDGPIPAFDKTAVDEEHDVRRVRIQLQEVGEAGVCN